MRPDRIVFLLALSAIALSAAVASAYTPPPVFRTSTNLQSGATCKTCHIDITEQWERSAHSKADRYKNLLFGRM